ncbi:kinase-like domain-containing protein [Mycotypha africana]|uniref:kinase-like domain-containing protein n=1 Tax=Mycotypha africana TaxID=64632 RepID=UPI0023003326|nr:kinase-like domain-containing protein [Mycotypha africana]KAI8991774.1 kinase-like domain-containing protein [Mycotypha africana]
MSTPPNERENDQLPSIPGCDTIIDLATLSKEELEKRVLKLIQVLFPEWAHDVKTLHLTRISGAMTNAVFFVNIPNEDKLVLRVYGVGVEQIIDRENELAWLARLSNVGIGARLLGVFGNGRFEEYLPSRTLNHHDIRDPRTSEGIAACLRELHDIVTIYPFDSTKHHLECWKNIDKWYGVVMSLFPALMKKNAEWFKVLSVYNLERLKLEIEECKKILSMTDSPIVFAHNDTQYGNVLKLEKTGELVVVDFEYAGYNPRAHDLANHFCEWTYDYHSELPAVMNMSRFPTYEEQVHFLKAYLDAPSKHTNRDVVNYAITPEDLQKEVAKWVMAIHVGWGLWGLIQAYNSEIDFDYFLFSMQRLNAFREELVKWKK